ncbi:hypothetical protein ACS0TY_001072 [Phlomoides rotata]
MVFTKLSELFFSTTTRLSAPKTSSLSYKSPGLPPTNPHGFSSSEKKGNLRLSSSLQDFSTYRQLDLEEGTLSSGLERIPGHEVPPYWLQRENGGSSFSKEKISPRVSTRQKCHRVICVLFGLFFIACFSFALQFLLSSWSTGTTKYYVVLDCGSTGTRVYVYQAYMNHEMDNNLPMLLKALPEDFQTKSGSQNGRAYNRMETEPGFDKLVHNVSGLKEAIAPLIEWAEQQIPKSSHQTTSLFLYATAGVRRLPSSDSEWLLNNAWSILKSSPFLCKKEWVKTITGVEEAYYGWIALNYHTKILGSIPKKETYGALDLGGSSLQVTFEGKQNDHDETSLKLSVGPVNHQLTAYSLAGYGLNDAFDKSVAHLLKRITNVDLVNGKVEINHPCLQSGYREEYTCPHCSSIHQEDGSSPVDGKVGKPGVPVQLIGVPNWAKCNELAKVAVNFSEWSNSSTGVDCELHPCALAEDLPHPVGQFYGMSGFYVVYRFFNLTSDATLDDILEKGHEFCEKTWDIARKSVVPQPFIEQYCFRAPYVVLLLREGLHITDRNVIIGSGSITWTLGVALSEAGKAFPYAGKFHTSDIFLMKINPLIFLAISFASLLLLLCVSSCARNWSKILRRRYLPLFNHNSVATTSVLNIPAPIRWSRIIGDGRAKMPLSPTVSDSQRSPYDAGIALNDSGNKFTKSSGNVAHSYSSGNLGQLPFESNNVGSSWTPNRSQTRLQSRRSQSREDLHSSISEANLVKL